MYMYISIVFFIYYDCYCLFLLFTYLLTLLLCQHNKLNNMHMFIYNVCLYIITSVALVNYKN